MLIYTDQPHSLEEYGILIPVKESRVKKTLEALKQNPETSKIVANRNGKNQQFFEAPKGIINREDLLRVHTRDYVDHLLSKNPERPILEAFELIGDDGSYNRYDPGAAEKPLSALIDRSLNVAAGTYITCREALKTGFAYYLGGGHHHGHPGFGHGFCVTNDVAIAVRKLQAENDEHSSKLRIWIIDVDVHKGDGTAAVFRDDRTVRTLSIHMAKGWPLDVPEFLSDGRRHPSWTPSDYDIPVAQREADQYNLRLRQGLLYLEELDGADTPDLAVILAGADPYEKDELPSTSLLNLTLPQLGERDRLVFEFFKKRSIPTAWVMSGGYGKHSWEVFAQQLIFLLHSSRY